MIDYEDNRSNVHSRLTQSDPVLLAVLQIRYKLWVPRRTSDLGSEITIS